MRHHPDTLGPLGPPLDPALLSAILGDYNLEDEKHVGLARDTLNPIKESALLQEEHDFDASRIGVREEGVEGAARPESCPDTFASSSQETDITTLSTAVSSIGLEGHAGDGLAAAADLNSARELEALDENSKVDLLLEVFNNRVSRYNALYTLRKCNGKWHSAMEELLNHVYFSEADHSDNESKISAKGIDAFSEDNIVRRERKSKGKRKQFLSLDEEHSTSRPVSPMDSAPPPANKWEASSKDIDFIATRTGLSTASISSLYYSNGASLASTIRAIAKSSTTKGSSTDDPIIAVNAHDLATEFPSITLEYAASLVRLTHPSTAAAHELAKALTTRPIAIGGIQIVPKYSALVEAEDEARLSSISKVPASSRLAEASYLDDSSAVQRASAYAAARSSALAQAQAAHRKAKSDRLMGGVAAYYGQVSRDYGVLSSTASAAAADQLAEAQSTPTQLDLHGIDVLNATRIAQERVEAWWSNLGEHRVNGRVGLNARQAGYRIIVGLGRHSEGGKGKLGPAITKMLKNNGWKMESANAVITVTGKARR